MNSQLNYAEHHSFKITFANLDCQINFNDTALFALAIRIGKRSSKYTQKKQIHEGSLEFDSILELPIDQSLLAQQSPRRQKVPLSIKKCELMLYKFRLNRDKKCKELVGMASVAVSNQMFEVESKKLRLTNSFDKEAFVQCRIKIELGEVDVLQHHSSQLSSFFVKQDQPSINNELTVSRAKEKNQSTSNTNHVKIGLITSNSRKSLREDSNQKSKGNNSFLELLNRTTKESPQFLLINISKSEKFLIKQADEPEKVNEFNLNNKDVQEQNKRLKEWCKELQQKNYSLQATVANLQNRGLNQSIISNRSTSSQIPQIPRPSANNKRSPMIKKNTKITVTPSFSKLQSNEAISTQDNLTTSHFQQKQSKPNSPKMRQIIREQANKLNTSHHDNENERSPYFSNKGPRIIEDTSKLSQQNAEKPLRLTFTGQPLTQCRRFSVTPVIQVKYTPPSYSKFFSTNSNDLNRSINYTSISQVEKSHCLSYTKFNGKKKYHIVGAIDVIKSPHNSQMNMSQLDHELDGGCNRQSGSIIVTGKVLDADKKEEKSFNLNNPKENPFNQFKDQEAQNENDFLDFLKEKDENPFLKNLRDVTSITTPKASQFSMPIPKGFFQERKIQNQLEADTDGQIRSRLTLEELDIKTQERFRKNERMLKIANTKILQENRTLKQQKQNLLKEIEKKKFLTQEEFEFLKVQINHLKQQIKQSMKIKQQSESKCGQFYKKFTSLEEENARLKKDLKQQRTKYNYYFKMSNINDDKEKEIENIGSGERTLNHKMSSGNLNSQLLTPANISNTSEKHQRSMTSISNFNKKDGSKIFSNQDTNSLKKAVFSIDKIDENQIDTGSLNKVEPFKKDSPKEPASSTAVSKLKMHIKPNISNPQMSQIFSQIQSPVNQTSSANRGTLKTGLIGTGQTIVVESQKINNFFSRK